MLPDGLSRLTAALSDRYRIEGELGAGGMATVYLAEDLKHHRKVAVKVLRPELAAALGSERFVREIEIAAGLHHPHILGVFDSGEAGGFLYYVMPHVDGESLRARLQQGELPIADAVRILIEVVDALTHAHAHGVVHRDIKPDNVLLSGRHALVTDFGVAKAVSEATGRQGITTAGVALGTPAYMAPEQAAADPNLDQRVDIYAVGVLGFELVAGRPPFAKSTAQATLAAHMTEAPPDPRTLRPACPPALAAIILRCLAKHPGDRPQTGEELLSQLEAIVTPAGGTAPTPAGSLAPVARRRWPRVVLAAGLLAGVALAYLLWPAGMAPRIEFGRRTQVSRDMGIEYEPAISPDGRFVAYTVPYERGAHIIVRDVDGGAPVVIARDTPRTQMFPVWSPDSRRLAFLSERGIEIIPALGGAARLLVPSALGPVASVPLIAFPGAFSPDGKELAYALRDTAFALDLTTETRRTITTVREPHSFTWSADGRWIALVSGNTLTRLPGSFYGNIAQSAIVVVAAGGGTPVLVAPATSANLSPVWLPDSRGLLFTSTRDGGADVYAVRIGRSGVPAGPAARVTTGLGASWITTSADGRTLAYASFADRSNVWSVPLPRGQGPVSVRDATPVTSGNQVIEIFDLSSDGRTIVFSADRSGRVDLYTQPVAGGEPQPLVTSAEPKFFPRFSPSGRAIAYHAFPGVKRQVFVVSTAGEQPTRVTRDELDERTPEWIDDTALIVLTNQTDSGYLSVTARQPDGSWGPLRYYASVTGPGSGSRDGRYVGFSRDGGLAVVPRGGGAARVVLGPPAEGSYTWPTWSDDGTRIYYLQDNGVLVTGVWSVPSGGGTPRLVVRFDDPTRPWHRFGLRVRQNRVFFTVGTIESDVWVAEMKVR